MRRAKAVLILIAAAFCAGAAEPYKPRPILEVRTEAITSPSEAAILDGAGKKFSAYEVYVSNFGAVPIVITELDVSAGSRRTLLERDSGKQLAAMFRGAANKGDAGPELKPSETGVFFIFPDLGSEGAAPDAFATKIVVTPAGDRSTPDHQATIDIPVLKVSKNRPVLIQAPIRGENWAAVNGPSNQSSHRRALLFANGQPRIGQRYAIDWVMLGADGNTYSGNEHDNRSYHAYDHDVRAAVAGEIVEVKDGIPENTPHSGKTAVPINEETLAGNHVIEDLGDGRFAAYAHLRPGTITAKRGDRVHAGDLLGRLGNTGNSTEPHLHFQVCNSSSFIDSEGLPFAINSFVRSDYKIGKDAAENPKLLVTGTHRVEREEPLENELDSFPGK